MKYLVTFACIFLISICQAQNPNDCEFAVAICGDSSLALDPDGVGFNEFSLPGNIPPPCYSFNNNTIWFRFDIETDGGLTFDLIPTNGTDDYDFAIYGPVTDCTMLGQSIRCSSTNPDNAGVPVDTGLNLTETDTNEGPGADGNGYLKYIEVTADEVYFMIVDRAHGSGGFDIFYTGTAGLPNPVMANPVNDQAQCDTDGIPDEMTAFDLDALIPIIQGSQTTSTVTFHETINDANIGINALISPYTNTSNPQTIYVRIENPEGCADFAQFVIEIGNPALMMPSDVEFCSLNTSEMYILNTIIPEVITDPSGYSFSYHDTLNEANANTNPLGATVNFTTTPRTIFVRVTDTTNSLCFSLTSFVGVVYPIQMSSQPTDVVVCDDDFDQFITIDLSTKDLEILNGLSPVLFDVLYYASVEDRAQDINRLNINYTTISNPQTIYVSMLELASNCYDYTEFIITVNPIPVPIFEQETYIYCLNTMDPVTIGVQSGFNYYVWNTGEEGPNLNTIVVNEPGSYSVTVTNQFNCTGMTSVAVFASEVATIIDIIVKDFSGKNNAITVIVEGIGDYEYALDNQIAFQDSNEFLNVSNGYHTIFVQDKNGCGIVSQEVLVLDYPRFFTPNGDEFNNRWKIIGIEEYPVTNIFIFNRYGKLLKQIAPTGGGWDGTNKANNPLPSSDYWFTITFEDGRVVKGHFTLKR